MGAWGRLRFERLACVARGEVVDDGRGQTLGSAVVGPEVEPTSGVDPDVLGSVREHIGPGTDEPGAGLDRPREPGEGNGLRTDAHCTGLARGGEQQRDGRDENRRPPPACDRVR